MNIFIIDVRNEKKICIKIPILKNPLQFEQKISYDFIKIQFCNLYLV